jgi:hypothetical protein
MAIIHNKNKKNQGTVLLHATANTTWVIAGNSTVSNVALAGEVLTGGSIRQAWYGSSSGGTAYWTVQRGSNTVLVLDSTGWVDFAGSGHLLDIDSTANVTVTINGAPVTAYIMLEIRKEMDVPVDADNY